MKITHLFALALLVAMLSGCDTPTQTSIPVMSTAEYAAREPIAASLFPADQALLGDDAVERILSSKLELPDKAKLALMRFPDTGAGEQGITAMAISTCGTRNF